MENNETKSPPADSGKKWSAMLENLNAQLMAGVLIVVLLAIIFLVFKPGSQAAGLDNLISYTDEAGQFSVMIPEKHTVLEEGVTFTVADPVEDDDEGGPMWSISVLPLIAEVTEDSELITEESVDAYVTTFLDSYIALIPEDTAGAPTELVANKVTNENSVHSVAIEGTYYQDNADGLNLYHKDLVIFDEYGSTLVLNFLMPAEDYSADLDDEIADITNSLQFISE